MMLDASLFYRRLLDSGKVQVQLPEGLPTDFYLLTLHRAENTNDPVRLTGIVMALNDMSDF